MHQGMKISFTAPAMILYNQNINSRKDMKGDRYEFY